MAKIILSSAVNWRYRCLSRKGTCKVDGGEIVLRLMLRGYTQEPPDVLDVEAWFAEFVSSPIVVEDLAIAAYRKWGMAATASGRTATHGWLTTRCGS